MLPYPADCAQYGTSLYGCDIRPFGGGGLALGSKLPHNSWLVVVRFRECVAGQGSGRTVRSLQHWPPCTQTLTWAVLLVVALDLSPLTPFFRVLACCACCADLICHCNEARRCLHALRPWRQRQP